MRLYPSAGSALIVLSVFLHLHVSIIYHRLSGTSYHKSPGAAIGSANRIGRGSPERSGVMTNEQKAKLENAMFDFCVRALGPEATREDIGAFPRVMTHLEGFRGNFCGAMTDEEIKEAESDEEAGE
jgi:hypothetical protein